MTRSTKPVSPEGKRSTGSKGDAPRARHGVRGGTCEANRMAVVILEVLAGARSRFFEPVIAYRPFSR